MVFRRPPKERLILTQASVEKMAASRSKSAIRSTANSMMITSTDSHSLNLLATGAGFCPSTSRRGFLDTIWVWVKTRYPKWNTDRWKQGLKPAVHWWFNVDPCPYDQLCFGNFRGQASQLAHIAHLDALAWLYLQVATAPCHSCRRRWQPLWVTPLVS